MSTVQNSYIGSSNLAAGLGGKAAIITRIPVQLNMTM